MRWTAAFGAAGLVVMSMTPCSAGQIIPLDDFEARDPALPGWVLADLSAAQPWGPAVYDPSSGALRVSHSGAELVPPGTPFQTTAMFGFWGDSTDPLFSNGYLRAKIRTNEVANSTSILMRGNLATGTAYLLFGGTFPPGQFPELDGMFFVSKFVNGVETNLWASGIEYLVGEDWNVELGTVGARVAGKVWRVGDPEPAAPQFSWIDPDPIPSGMVGFASDKSAGNTILARGDATFDDFAFTAIPEPTGLVLLLAGLLAGGLRSRSA